MKTYTTDKGEQDPDAVCRRDMQIEQHDGECDGEYLFTATIFVSSIGSHDANRKKSDVLCRNGHRQSARLFIRGKTDDVQPTGNHSIDQERNSFGGCHLGCAVCADTFEFTSVPAVDYALDECERGHAHEEVKGVL